MWWTVLYIFITIVLIWLIKSFFKQRGLPHGPFKLPFIGNLLILLKDQNKRLNLLTQTYGSMFTIWIGRVPFIVINDYYAAKEVLIKNDKSFSSRPDIFPNILTRDNTRLPYMNYCPVFTQKKQKAKDILNAKDDYFNMYIKIVMKKLVKDFESMAEEKITDPTSLLNDCTMDLLSYIIYGCKIDSKYEDLSLNKTMETNLIPSLSKIVPWISLFYRKSTLEVAEFFSNRESILHSAFLSIYETENPNKCFAANLINNLSFKSSTEKYDYAEKLSSDLFLSGLDPLTSTFKWLLLYLITWPEIQEKLSAKLNRKFEKDEFLQMEDAMSIPYLQAAVLETIRLSSVTPLSLPHVTTESVTLKGYKLPEGTSVVINMSAIHHSSKYWSKPFEFNPSRFLTTNDDGLQQLVDIHSIPGYLGFGSGLRKCVGHELSMKLLVTVIANLILKFHFEVTPWVHQSNLTGMCRLILSPSPYHVKVTSR